jgi:hypothetical protein
MKFLDRRNIFGSNKNGKKFRFLGKENNDKDGRRELLEGLIALLSPPERMDLILKITDENRDLVKEVINNVGTQKKSAPSQNISPEVNQKNVQEKIEKVLAKPVPVITNATEAEKKDETGEAEKNTNAPLNEGETGGTEKVETTDEKSTEHNQDRAHQDLEKKSYETKEETPLDKKNAEVSDDIKKFREDIDVYIKRALPEKGLALKQGSDEMSRRYAIEKHTLDQIQVFAEPIWSDLRPRLQNYESKITNFAAEYRSLKDEPDPNVQFLKQKELVESFQAHINAWQQLSQKIKHAKERLVEVCQKVMGIVRGKMFARDYFQGFEMYLDGLGKTLQDFDALATEKNFDFSGEEIFWTTIPKRIQVLKKYLNFNGGGKINEFSVGATELFKKQANGIKFLHRNQFFEEEGDEKLRKNFKESVNRVNDFRQSYKNKFYAVKSILEKDLNKLDETDFFEKYKNAKNSVYEYLQGQADQIKRFNEANNEYGKRKFINNWIQNYNNESSRSEALQQMTAWAEFDTAVSNSKDHNKPEFKILNELDIFIQNKNRPRKYDISYFSLHDAQQMFKEYFEYRTRLWNRRSERAVAALGVKAFGSPNDSRTESQIAKEFTKKDEETEDARVNEYKTQKGSYNVWDIKEDLYNTSDADEAKACIDMLIDKGGLEWFDQNFWNLLNRLEGFQRFKPTDVNKDRGELNRKLRESISNIWSEDYFNTWSTQIESSRKSAMESYAGEYDSYETDDSPVNPRTRIMTEMVHKAYNGINEGVDPARFEGFLRAAIPAGKQNGGPRYDQRVWFLIHGVASGLLGPEAFARMNGGFLYDLPIVDFFTDKAAWKKDGLIVPADTPGAKDRPWSYQDYKKWGEMLGSNGGTYAPVQGYNSRLSKFIYNNIMNADSVRDRTQRGVRGAKERWDHDDGAMYTPVLTANDVGQMLTAESKGTEQMTSDFWRRFLEEYKFVFHSILEQINSGDLKYGLDDPGWSESRIKLLKQVGERIKAGLTVTLTLSGNLGLIDGRPTAPFSKSKWEKATGYSPSAENSKKIVDSMANIFLKNANIDETEKSKYEKLINYRASFEGKGPKNATFKVGNEEFKTQIEASKLVVGNVGTKIFSSDLDVIERSLREFCQKNLVLPGE